MTKLLVLTVALVALASSAFAAGNATLTVTAAVQGTCSFNTGGTLAFGALNPAAPVDVTLPSAGVTFTCTNGTNYTITDDSVGNPMTGPGAPIPFSLAYATTGTGTGAAAPLAINGTVLGADYAAATPGVYATNVTLSILP